MGFDIKKFLSGFNILSGEKRGKLIFYAIIIVIGLTIYHQAFKPKTIIGTQIVHQETKSSTVAMKVNIWKLFLELGLR